MSQPTERDLALRKIIETALEVNLDLQQTTYSLPADAKCVSRAHEIHLRLGCKIGLTYNAAVTCRRLFAGKRVLWLTSDHGATRIAQLFPEATVRRPVEVVGTEPVPGEAYNLVVVDSGYGYRGLISGVREFAAKVAPMREGEFRMLVLG